jgi:hypothetical protein
MADLSQLQSAVEARSGLEVDAVWLSSAFDEALAFIRLLAPCKRAEWIDFDSLPPDVVAVLIAALTRMVLNPKGIRQETIGEYSYTLAGVNALGGSGTGPFTGAEGRIISVNAGCGGSFKSVPMTAPAVLNLDAPEVREKEPLGRWIEPSHANGFQKRWVRD